MIMVTIKIIQQIIIIKIKIILNNSNNKHHYHKNSNKKTKLITILTIKCSNHHYCMGINNINNNKSHKYNYNILINSHYEHIIIRRRSIIYHSHLTINSLMIITSKHLIVFINNSY